jgi:hypothetical protein
MGFLRRSETGFSNNSLANFQLLATFVLRPTITSNLKFSRLGNFITNKSAISMKKIIHNIFILLLLLSITACNLSRKSAAGVVVGTVVAGAVGGVVVGSIIADQPIGLNEIKLNEVLKIEFKDREFLESQITDKIKIHRIVSQIKQVSIVDPVKGSFYQTVELVLTDDRIVRVGVYDSYLKNGNAYYKMGKELNEEIKKHF